MAWSFSLQINMTDKRHGRVYTMIIDSALSIFEISYFST